MRKIAGPRPLKRSLVNATTVPTIVHLEIEDPDSDDCFAIREHDAERELQEILCNGGFCSTSINVEPASAFEPPEMPFFNFGQDEGFDFDFPRLGLSPVPMVVGQEASLPGRARNPITLNTPFGMQKEIIAQSIMPLASQLELLNFSDEAARMRRSRSYSEPLPFVYATGETSAN